MADHTENAKKLHHLGFICDGNRRWARSRNLPTLEGHTKGYGKVEMIIDAYKDSEIKFLSFFLFSTENWDRSEEEVSYLMRLAETKILSGLTKRAKSENLRVVVMGRPEKLKPALWQKFLQLEEATAENTGLTVCLCFNYGGTWEIADAATRAIKAGEQNLTPESFAGYLYHPEVPPMDMVVRTSGEQRLSGFMLWRAAYSEFYFLDKHFPAITTEDCTEILQEYHKRQRRFGK